MPPATGRSGGRDILKLAPAMIGKDDSVCARLLHLQRIGGGEDAFDDQLVGGPKITQAAKASQS